METNKTGKVKKKGARRQQLKKGNKEMHGSQSHKATERKLGGIEVYGNQKHESPVSEV